MIFLPVSTLVIYLTLPQEQPIPAATIQDLGTVSLLDSPSPIATRSFILPPAESAVVLTRIAPSCHCVGAVLNDEANAYLPLSLVAGQSVPITVSIHLDELRPGPFTKSVLVYARKASDSSEFIFAQLTVRGTLAPAVVFTRDTAPAPLSVLALGTRDQSRTAKNAPIILTVQPDPRLLAPGQPIPPLVASLATIRTTRLADAPNRALRYRIETTPDAPIGTIIGTLSFTPPATQKDNRADAWRSASLVFTGELIGDIAASPSVVAFGITRTGSAAPSLPTPTAPEAAAVRTVTLTARTADALVGMKVDCDNPAIRTQLLPPSTPTEQTLRITLASETIQNLRTSTASGSFFSAWITVSLASGQKLLLPVSAFLQ